ncbi:DNA sulfur modification protein DndD [Anoxybacillus flavithermus]|uniref:Nuclease SbcCD subunit C n=1 Tax=Anoxybacillus flavithermus TaxID=33934 RepID=A0A2G5RMK5_9BACL|nr:DNA sulfur modification protein DndD [Anoxybacillus flavithermus]PIC03975.1 DNA sulfur modification protein DndD [Anoxybacillus flavithermus]
MIFEYIRFKNYRPYYGEQTMYFRDKNKEKNNFSVHKRNIILIGGLNGHGKTSLINSIFICFYGRRKFKQKEYNELLRNAVNKKHIMEGGKEGSIELAFTDETGSYAIEVIFNHDELKEIRRVYELNQELKKIREIATTEQAFYEFIDQRIPMDVSQFFIFDAEKIRDLVGEQEQSETIKAIQRVVSLELYNQLLKDLDHISRELTNDLRKQVKDEDIKSLFERLEEINEKLDRFENEEQKINEEIANLSEEEVELQRKRRQMISSSSATKQQLNRWIGEHEQKLKHHKDFLKKFKERDLQQLILLPAIRALKQNLKREKEYLEAKYREELQFVDYENFIVKLLEVEIDPPLTEKQKKQLKINGREVWARLNNIQRSVLKEQIQTIHDVSNKDYQTLINYPEARSRDIKPIIEEMKKAEEMLRKYQSQLEDAPDEIDTSEIDEKIRVCNQRLGELRIKKKQLYSLIRKLRDERFRIQSEITKKEQEKNKPGPIEQKIDLTNRLRNATQEFIDRVTLLKAKQLKLAVEAIIEQMFRKNEFGKVEFHQEKFTLTIYDQEGKVVDLMSRSEGEKQLIALAMIWALTKVSGKQIPFVIDTPLARLDSIHRSNLVNHYFTKLSDQVIILSTDTEITQDFYEELAPFIEKSYLLTFDEHEKYTKIEEGYFFEKVTNPWLA